MWRLRLALLLLLVAILPGQAQAAHILAFTPHVCEILYAVGAGDGLVGADECCDYPEAVREQKLIRLDLCYSSGYALLDRAAMHGISAVDRLPLSNGLYSLPVEFALQ